MTRWYPQPYLKYGQSKGITPSILTNAIKTAEITLSVNPELPPLFSLRHLAEITSIDYGILRSIIKRSDQTSYRIFRIRKKAAYPGEQRFRVIAVPSPPLMRIQRWINQQILMRATAHRASVAFAKQSKLVDAAQVHCGCKWLIKLDVRNFFESISEVSVYRIFRSLGYQPLISFEMAKLCTRKSARIPPIRSTPRWQKNRERTKIEAYRYGEMGFLPQGAPTSPMLANLAVREFDNRVSNIAKEFGLSYTRYADDIALSTPNEFSREKCSKVIGQVFAEMGKFGLSPNLSKIRISPPGARKIILGLLVDRETPKLSKEFKANMRQHIHHLSRSENGVKEHAYRRHFNSLSGLRHHVFGLASYAEQIEPQYGLICRTKLEAVAWPI